MNDTLPEVDVTPLKMHRFPNLHAGIGEGNEQRTILSWSPLQNRLHLFPLPMGLGRGLAFLESESDQRIPFDVSATIRFETPDGGARMSFSTSRQQARGWQQPQACGL